MQTIFQSDLSSLSYEELVENLEAISDETERLEIKQELSDKNRIANTACALANTFGGLIVIGFLDPERSSGSIIPSLRPLDTSSRAVNGLISSIQAKTYPSVRCEGYGVRSADGEHGAIVLRVHEAEFGPHEYIGGGEFRNLVVRRQRENAPMPLSHLVSLQQKSQGSQSASPIPLVARQYPLVQIRPFNAGDDEYFFGALVRPEQYPSVRRILRRRDEEELCRIVRLQCPRLNRMSEQTLVDGLLFDAQTFESNKDKTDQRLHIRVDGEVTLRMEQNIKDHPYFSEIVFLGNVYLLGSRVFHYLNVPPRARVNLAFKCAETVPALPSRYEDVLLVDFSRTSVNDFIRDAMLIAGRAAKCALNDDQISDTINRIWSQEFGGMNPGDLRNLWD